MFQNGGLPWLILKNTLGLCTVLPRVHFPVRRTPLIPGVRKAKTFLLGDNLMKMPLSFTQTRQKLSSAPSVVTNYMLTSVAGSEDH